MEHGVSADALLKYFWVPAKRLIAHENIYGRVIAAAADLFMRNNALASVHFSASLRASGHRDLRKLHFVNWNMITGERPYREVARAVASPRFALGLVGSGASLMARRVLSRMRARRMEVPFRAASPNSSLGPLRDGQTVAILGGGPAGASCPSLSRTSQGNGE